MPSADVSFASGWLLRAARSYVQETSPEPWPVDPASHLELLHLTSRAGLVTLVDHQLAAAGLPVPPDLRRLATTIAMQKLAQRADLHDAARCLDQAGVRWMLIKGPVLDTITYRVPGLRHYNDIDMVVHPADFARGWDALQALPAEDLDGNWARLAATRQSEINLRLPRGTLLDLHWHVISNEETRTTFDLDVKAFFTAAIEVDLHGLTLRTMSATDTALYVALHAALAGGHELRWMVDLHEAERRVLETGERDCFRADELHLALVHRVMVSRMRATLRPTALPAQRRGLGGTWLLLAQVVGRFLPVSAPGGDRYTGRAFFSSTRTGLRTSLVALASASRRAVSHGRARRHAVVDRTPLHEPGGTRDDLDDWLSVIASAGRADTEARG